MNNHPNETPRQSGLSDPGRIKEILSRHGFHFSKALGQNFLINPGVCPRMAAECGAQECAGVIEVGPGIGVLTWELSQVAKKWPPSSWIPVCSLSWRKPWLAGTM